MKQECQSFSHDVWYYDDDGDGGGGSGGGGGDDDDDGDGGGGSGGGGGGDGGDDDGNDNLNFKCMGESSLYYVIRRTAGMQQLQAISNMQKIKSLLSLEN
jgi:hypothetical protein